MQKSFLLLALSATLANCQREQPAPSEDLTALKEQFHGKYRIVSATSPVAVDLDEDGQAATDLLQEIPNLAASELEIRVGRSVLKQGYVGLLDQGWQHQQVVRVRYQTGPDSIRVLGFVNQLTPRYFNFTADYTHLVVEQVPLVPSDNGQYPAPASIVVTGPAQLEVVTNRLLFVQKAWRLVPLTVHYQRYTKTT